MNKELDNKSEGMLCVTPVRLYGYFKVFEIYPILFSSLMLMGQILRRNCHVKYITEGKL
jgi:hypothetical protein